MGPCVAGGPGGLQEAWARSRACFCARALVCQPSLPCSGVRPLPLTRAHPTSPAPIAVVGVSLSLCWTCLCVRHPVGGGVVLRGREWTMAPSHPKQGRASSVTNWAFDNRSCTHFIYCHGVFIYLCEVRSFSQWKIISCCSFPTVRLEVFRWNPHGGDSWVTPDAPFADNSSWGPTAHTVGKLFPLRGCFVFFFFCKIESLDDLPTILVLHSRGPLKKPDASWWGPRPG